MNDNPLTNLRETIRAHWREHLPRLYADLEDGGALEASVENTARNTEEAVRELTAKGLPLLSAWEQVREEWAILPAEEDEAQ